MDATYRRRVLDEVLDDLASELPAIEIFGAKGVGKTETARRRAATVIALDDPVERDLLAGDPDRVRRVDHPLLLDEWQRFPRSWDLVRRAVDDHEGSYLLTGSSVPAEAPTHSGAGRMVSYRMRPLSLAERGIDNPTVSLSALFDGDDKIDGHTELGLPDYANEITGSGFPDLHGLSVRSRSARLEGYVHSIVQRSFPEQGLAVRKPQALRDWLTAYAAATSTTTTYQRILKAATPGDGDPPSRQTADSYRTVLEQLWLLDPLPAWQPSRNRLSRLARSPKHQLADPALAAHLLGVSASALLRGSEGSRPTLYEGALLGALFENLVAQSVQVYAQITDARVFHMRSDSGDREIDIIVEHPDGRVIAIEVKVTQNPSSRDVRHLLWLKEELGENLTDMLVITPGPWAHRREDGVAVVPAALLGP
jgi:predicted AAA+ superfamily ATPase